MQVTSSVGKAKFEPVVVTITLETQEEYDSIRRLCSANESVPTAAMGYHGYASELASRSVVKGILDRVLGVLPIR